MHALVVGEVGDRSAAADDEDRVVSGDVGVEFVEIAVVLLQLGQVGRVARVRALGHPRLDVERRVQPARLFELPPQSGVLLGGHRASERGVDVVRVEARRKRVCTLSGRRGEYDLVAPLVELRDGSYQFFGPVTVFGDNDQNLSAHVFLQRRLLSLASPTLAGPRAFVKALACDFVR